MIGGTPSDDEVLALLADGPPVLASEFDGGFDSFRAGVDEEDSIEFRGREGSEQIGQLAGGLVDKLGPVGEGDFVELGLRSRNHSVVSVSEVGGKRSRAAVEVAFAFGVPQVQAFGVGDGWELLTGLIEEGDVASVGNRSFWLLDDIVSAGELGSGLPQ